MVNCAPAHRVVPSIEGKKVNLTRPPEISPTDRINTVNFSLTLSGFLIPDVLQKKINSESTSITTGNLSVMIGENVDQESISETLTDLDLNSESGNTNGGYHPISNIADRFKLK